MGPVLLSNQIGRFLSAFIAGYFLLQYSLVTGARYFQDSAAIFQLMLIAIILIALFSISLVIVQLARALVFSDAEKIFCHLSLPLIFTFKFFSPLRRLLEIISRAFELVVSVDIPVESDLAISARELSEMAQEGREAVNIEEDEREMLESVFGFGETFAREVMTPRKDIVYVSQDDSLLKTVDVFVEEGLSRLLVVGSNLDDIKGIILSKDLLPFLRDSKEDFCLKTVMRPAYFTSGSKKIDDLLREFRKERVHLAVVLDEHGGVDGIVTLEDLVEEIIGEISDEYDEPEELDQEQEKDKGAFSVEGSLLVDDFNYEYDCDLPAGEYDTLAGFVIHQLGRLPEVNEELSYNGLLIKVEEVAQNRILRLEILPTYDSAINKSTNGAKQKIAEISELIGNQSGEPRAVSNTSARVRRS
jgi:CBS domain containing-hemolysin-like protein